MSKPDPQTLQEMRKDKPQTPGRDWVTILLIVYVLAVVCAATVVGLFVWLS